MSLISAVAGVAFLFLINTAPAMGACITPIDDYAREGAPIDAEGRVIAFKADGSPGFLVKAIWDVDNAGNLVAQDPVNRVSLEFFTLDGELASAVAFDSFRLVMDMGGHAHTTDECPAVAPLFENSEENVWSIDRINFVMGSRRADKWFFYNLTATVNGVTAVVARYNVPHPVR